MSKNYIRDERGVAMLLELVLVAGVLALVGVAVYQATHHNTPTASVETKKATNAKVDIANAAAAIGDQEANADASISANADAAASQLNEAEVDVTNLGGSSSANAL